MNSLLLLVPISLILLGIGVGLFVWAVRKGQYDDLDSPAIDILRDDPMEPHAANRRNAPAAERAGEQPEPPAPPEPPADAD